MLPWRRSDLSYLITPRLSPACTGSVVVAAPIVHDRCESWCLTEKQHSKLGQLHARCVRSMSHITLPQSRMYQIPTREIETELGLDSMDKYIARRQLRCLGHVRRMPFHRLLRRLLSSWLPYKRPTYKRPRGAPEMTFGKTMIKALKTFDTDPKQWPSMAANRTYSNWRHRTNK